MALVAVLMVLVGPVATLGTLGAALGSVGYRVGGLFVSFGRDSDQN